MFSDLVVKSNTLVSRGFDVVLPLLFALILLLFFLTIPPLLGFGLSDVEINFAISPLRYMQHSELLRFHMPINRASIIEPTSPWPYPTQTKTLQCGKPCDIEISK
jgi:hypothetical protein